jgi:hypothetical protein
VPTIADARRWAAGSVLAWQSVPLGLLIIVLSCWRRSRSPRPQARNTNRRPPRQRPKGEGAPQGGAGRGRAAERGPGAHDSPRPERRKPAPRAATVPPPQHPNKMERRFCWGAAPRGGGGRQNRSRSNSAEKFRKPGGVALALGGYYDTPPRE